MVLRYNDAATVSDEHGKGVEILRQQTADVQANTVHALLVAEADTRLRRAWVVTAGTNITAGTVQIIKRAPEVTAHINMSAATAIPVSTHHAVAEIELTRVDVARGEIVQALVVGKNPTTAASVITVHLGWMPDLFNPDANPRSYTSPV